MECKRQVQKGKCRQGTHNGRKHARWPATTCGFICIFIQVPTAKFRTWSQRGVSTDGGSYDAGACGKCSNIYFFYKNGFEHQQKVKPNQTKTRCLKKFDIRREPKGNQREPKGSQREPKGSPKEAKREPKIKKIIKVFSLSFFRQNCKNGHGALVGIT